jgi:hypothetical protein
MLPQLALLPVARRHAASGKHIIFGGSTRHLQVCTAQNRSPGNCTTAANNYPAANVAAVHVLML